MKTIQEITINKLYNFATRQVHAADYKEKIHKFRYVVQEKVVWKFKSIFVNSNMS